jgi:hypothetical protein
MSERDEVLVPADPHSEFKALVRKWAEAKKVELAANAEWSRTASLVRDLERKVKDAFPWRTDDDSFRLEVMVDDVVITLDEESRFVTMKQVDRL